MTKLDSKTGFVSNYAYRADGLRVSKKVVTPQDSLGKITKYRYDGQMGIEDVELNSSGVISSLTRYGLGARGIDVVSRTTSSGNQVSYPLYDAHGNNIGALSKSGNSFTVSDEKSYDAWGGLRVGTNANGKAAYCANLGHKQDDESGLIYMRARYYEPTSGRFVSQDRNYQGANLYIYCDNDPANRVDESGNDWVSITKALLQAIMFITGEILLDMWTNAENQISRLTKYISQLEDLLSAGTKLGGTALDLSSMKASLTEQKAMLSRAKFIKGGQAVLKVMGYMMIVKAFLMDIDWEGDGNSGLDIILGNF